MSSYKQGITIMKYEFVPIYRIVDGKILTRIRALIDIKKWGIKCRDLGGYVESEHNLDQNTDAWISGFCFIHGDKRISGNTFIYNDDDKKW